MLKPGKCKLVSFLLLATLIVVAGYAVFTPEANANEYYWFNLRSRQDNGATVNLGKIKINGLPAVGLPQPVNGPLGPTSIRYDPSEGYHFVRWESTGQITFANPLARDTTVNPQSEGTITAVYASTQSVGGVIQLTNTLALFTPYLAAVGLVATAAIAIKKHRN